MKNINFFLLFIITISQIAMSGETDKEVFCKNLSLVSFSASTARDKGMSLGESIDGFKERHEEFGMNTPERISTGIIAIEIAYEKPEITPKDQAYTTYHACHAFIYSRLKESK